MDDKRTEVIVKCKDNCSCLSIDKFDNESDDYFITIFKSYSTKNFIERLKDIFRILTGKSVIDFEIILTNEDLDKLRNFK